MSSDSSDDEDLDKLREATDPQFIDDALFDKKRPKIRDAGVQKLPSLRRNRDVEQQFNLFGVSPEVRSYIAKNLSTMLDKVLEHKLGHNGHCSDHTKPKRRKGGIKLLKSSPHYLKLKPSDPQLLRKKFSVKLEDSDDEERCKSVAVTPEDILSRKETKHWSNRSKAPVFTYSQTAQGLILK